MYRKREIVYQKRRFCILNDELCRSLTPGNVAVTNASRSIEFINCDFRHLGAAGASTRGGSQGIAWRRCSFEDVSAGAVVLGDIIDAGPETDANRATPIERWDMNLTVEDCTISDCGIEYSGATAILRVTSRKRQSSTISLPTRAPTQSPWVGAGGEMARAAATTTWSRTASMAWVWFGAAIWARSTPSGRSRGAPSEPTTSRSGGHPPRHTARTASTATRAKGWRCTTTTDLAASWTRRMSSMAFGTSCCSFTTRWARSVRQQTIPSGPEASARAAWVAPPAATSRSPRTGYTRRMASGHRANRPAARRQRRALGSRSRATTWSSRRLSLCRPQRQQSSQRQALALGWGACRARAVAQGWQVTTYKPKCR